MAGSQRCAARRVRVAVVRDVRRVAAAYCKRSRALFAIMQLVDDIIKGVSSAYLRLASAKAMQGAVAYLQGMTATTLSVRDSCLAAAAALVSIGSCVAAGIPADTREQLGKVLQGVA